MIEDGLTLFTGTSNGATGGITYSAYADAPTTGTQQSSNVLDLGVLSGVPSSAAGGGARDLGVGDNPALKVSIIVPVAFVGGTSLQVEIDGAPDNGSGGQGSYTIMWQSQAIAIAQLTQGFQLANIDLPRVVPGQPLPRFLRMRFVSVGTFTAGAVQANIVIDRDDQIVGVAGNYSGMPSGITVAN